MATGKVGRYRTAGVVYAPPSLPAARILTEMHGSHYRDLVERRARLQGRQPGQGFVQARPFYPLA